ncbi:MAG: hypothetical protein A2687_02810 [Candidatus Levybacteria bacterium RIFCSPHIGHO2_01_FULL_38_26]|nr:MAG: hypothetical protein A2687_02810 [Candidatus Levybacteria bacterium RIFCSPHIGHO2_01_FULL_38_26]
MKKLILIDGNAILHRAFHALPPLTKNGEIINAVYGFFSMFIKILEDQKPTHIVVCFDRAAPTFRKEMYVGYQSKRPKVSDDLVPQIKKVHDILGNAKISIFEIDGYEADDMIGTISVQAVSGKLDGQMEVVIVSGDRDLLQLVNSHVKMIAPVTGLTNMIVYDSAKVEEKFGIKPSQIVDYKALIGDSSDNYPGITGIGPKTAANLLREYGSFENMYKKIDSLPPKIAEKLVTDAEQAALAKKLATIVIDAPIKLSLEECSFSDSNFQALKNEFERLDFKSLLKRLEPNGSKEKKEPKEPEETEEKKKKGKNHQLGFL